MVRRALQLLVAATLQAVALFLPAGTLHWGAGWAYVGLYVAIVLAGAVVLRSGHREVVEERSRGRSGGQAWEVRLTRVLTVAWLALLVVAGLAVRFDWQPTFGMALQAVGGVLLVLGYVPVLWAMRVNRFFGQVVRIQAERDHVAVTDGPYRYVRHPGYAGMLVTYAGTVLLLGSPWAAIPLLVAVALLLRRTVLEDRVLTRELPGYREFRERTRFRLVPGVW